MPHVRRHMRFKATVYPSSRTNAYRRVRTPVGLAYEFPSFKGPRYAFKTEAGWKVVDEQGRTVAVAATLQSIPAILARQTDGLKVSIMRDIFPRSQSDEKKTEREQAFLMRFQKPGYKPGFGV